MEHNNPYENWRKRQTYYDRREQKSGEAIKIIVKTFLVCLAFALLGWLLSGCTTTKYMPVTERHTEHHWHTDTVRQCDTTHIERSTIIRELDSAAMAKYGIQMESNQRAWLVLQREMENRLRELEHMSTQKDTVHDSIPVPYPVEKTVKVEKPLTWWQQARLHLANITLCLLAIFVGAKLWKYRKKILP